MLVISHFISPVVVFFVPLRKTKNPPANSSLAVGSSTSGLVSFYSSSLPMPEDAQVHTRQQQPQHPQQFPLLWQHFFIDEKPTPVAR
jgi:hypothetical protein